jgi:3-carboxy-cis,cis-muconate cycloisomerase
MPTSTIDSLIIRDIFGSPAMRRVWSDEFRTQKYLDWEAALACAQAKVGVIPQEAADEITSVCKVENIDFDRHAREMLNRLSCACPRPSDQGDAMVDRVLAG